MRKKITAVFLIMALAVGGTACGKSTSDNTETSKLSVSDTEADSSVSDEKNTEATEENGGGSEGGSGTTSDEDEYFADGDYKDVTSEEPDATITLSGDTGTISDTSRGTSGNEVTITSKGIYRVTGSSENVTIVVDDDNESGNVYLVLDNVTMTNADSACISIEASDKTVIQCVGDNKLIFTGEEGTESESAIYAKDDITINGNGTLSITSNQHGIVGKDDVKITGAALTVSAASIGIRGGDSVRIGGGTQNITSGHDGIQVVNDTADSYFIFKEADLTIDAGYDGIDVGESEESDAFIGFMNFLSGKVTITAGGGSDNAKDSSTSQKGIKCDGDINIEESSISVSSADDCINSDGNITNTSGILSLSTSDDGMTAYSTINIEGGSIDITKSYEGLEACYININAGDINIVASDDGINTAGGSDTTSTEMGPWGSESTDAELNINGGTVYVNAQGDGLDSNGSLYVTGGVIIVEGPTGNDNGALDIGDSADCVASITGGVVLAIGSTGMAVNFNAGSQCSALVNLSGSEGTVITVDDGSDFSYTVNKSFECAVYSSPDMTEGNTYTISAGSGSATMDFSSGLYYSDVSSRGGMGACREAWAAEVAVKHIRLKSS